MDSRVYSLLADLDGSTIKADIQSWWGDLYRQLYADHETAYTQETFAAALGELEDMFRQRQHLAVNEMPIETLKGEKVLEIGPGGGGHSALFKYRGADITAVDITPERALGTAIKLQLVSGSKGRAFQADAENLPFKDNSFDIVYSNGVLHHSEDTDKCLAEVHRVLKPGGQAIIMLYARHSATFWLNILPRAILTGEIFRWPEAQWIGRLTEGTPKFGATVNPVTRVYSSSEIENAFAAFDLSTLRKSSFQFDNFALPKLTQLRRGLLRLLGQRPHAGGKLVYGQLFYVETRLEKFLGRFIGFAWNIKAFKRHPSEMDEAS
jgi:ubiquinone/menaquinone biosynthesis C-methylase UbiE